MKAKMLPGFGGSTRPRHCALQARVQVEQLGLPRPLAVTKEGFTSYSFLMRLIAAPVQADCFVSCS